MPPKPGITYDELKEMCTRKIPAKVPKEPGPFPGAAVNGGAYLGAPGKEVFAWLPFLSDKQMDEIAEIMTERWPVFTGAHVGNAACIRYIYGQFEKQGALKSKEIFRKMRNDFPDWELPRKFIKIMEEKFKEKNKHYGLCILYEMEGHRLGDEAWTQRNKEKGREMEKTYLASVKHAHKCNSYKQMFTPYFWVSRYFSKLGDYEKSVYYAKKTIEEAEKHCPDKRESYVQKLRDCIDHVRSVEGRKWKNWKKYCKRHITNPCVIKAWQKY